METITQENSTGRLSREFVRDGVAGNYQIVLEMIRVIRNSVNYDIGLEHLAKGLLTNNNFDSYSAPEKQLEIIYRFVTSNVKYIQDKAGLVESIKSARVTLSDGYGDCDDLTNTVATLVGLLGFEDVKIAMARYFKEDSSFAHVYPVVYINGSRVVMDASLPNGKFGDEVAAVEIKEVSVFDSVAGLDGFSGLFNNTRYHAKKLGRAAIETLPHVANYLPLGFVSSQAFATGAELLNQSGGRELSLNATASKINQELDKIIVDLICSRTALDMAKSYALSVSAQLSAVKAGRGDLETYAIIKQSVQSKLDFINNFESFAKQHHIKVVYLNASAVLAVGAAGVGVGIFTLYKLYKKRG